MTLEALKVADFSCSPNTSRYLKPLHLLVHDKRVFNPNFGNTLWHIHQNIWTSSHSMAHLSQSCGSSCQSTEKNKERNNLALGQNLTTYMPLRPFSVEHRDTGCLMLVWLSIRPWSWPTFKSGLRNPSLSLLLPSCPLMTQRCSSMIGKSWKMKPGMWKLQWLF